MGKGACGEHNGQLKYRSVKIIVCGFFLAFEDCCGSFCLFVLFCFFDSHSSPVVVVVVVVVVCV